jgi:hypothetical protein
MKLLPLDFTYRSYLINKYALLLDREGNETLVALSREESLEYLVFFEYATKGILPISTGRMFEFLAMHERHTAALSGSMWLVNAIYGFDNH